MDPAAVRRLPAHELAAHLARTPDLYVLWRRQGGVSFRSGLTSSGHVRVRPPWCDVSVD
jgi:hypothetical protein